MSWRSRLIVPLILSLVLPSPTFCDVVHEELCSYAPYMTPDKLTVVATFDGSLSLAQWEKVLTWADENDVRFTFFISSVYYLPDNKKGLYFKPPDFVISGKSDIAWGGSSADVKKRIEWTLKAAAKGHDIESHLNGHFNGVRWKETAWRREFQQFTGLCHFLKQPVSHIRFPHLAMNGEVYTAMAESNLKSIVSTVSGKSRVFHRITVPTPSGTTTILEFPIEWVKYEGTFVPFSDFSFFEIDQKMSKNPEQAADDMVKVYLLHAKECYENKRPFVISHHFSDMNKGAYWEAEKRVLSALKKTYKTEFLTVSQLYDRIEKQAPTSSPLVVSAETPAIEKIQSAPPEHLDEKIRKTTELQVAKPQISAQRTAPEHFEQEEPPTIAKAEEAMAALPPLTHSSVDLSKPGLNQMWPDGNMVAFDGVLHEAIPMVIKLSREQLRISGKAFYKRYGVDIKIKGSIDEHGDFVLYEVLPKGIVCGMLHGSLTEKGLTGTWTKPDGSIPRNFKMAQLSDAQLYESIQRQIHSTHKTKQ